MLSIVVQTSKMNIHRRFSMKKDNSNIKVILFDLDGTLLDSRDFLVQTSFDILQKNYPNQFPYEHIEADFGNGFARLLPNKQSEIGKQSLREFHATKLKKYHETSYFPGVTDGLRHLNNQGLQLGIVTNQNKQIAMQSLKYHNIKSLFAITIGNQDVSEGKPSPEGINQAIAALQCEKENVLMVGDSRFDMIAGERAGVKTGFLKWYENLNVPKESPPTYVFENFDTLLETIIGKTIA